MDFLKSQGIETIPIRLNEDVPDDINSFLIYGAHPISLEKALQYMKSEGRKIVYDVDDALSLIDMTNPFYYLVKKDLGSVKEILEYADEVTVSTQAMADFMRPQTEAPITIVPNCYTPSEWTFTRPEREGLRIGFAGSSTHLSDLIPILPTIAKLQKSHNIKFLIMGFSKNDYRTWFKEYRYVTTEEGMKELIEFDRLMSEISFEWVPFVDFESYPATLTNMSLDIGICPLKDTPFNRCRSACKAMEYTLSGALALASDLDPYQNEESSILVKDDQWETALTYFIENPALIKGEQMKSLEWIKENRNIDTQLETLKKVYGV